MSRLDALLARQAAAKAKAESKAPTAKPVATKPKVKPAKAKSVESERVKFEPETLLECVKKLTPEEAAHPKWVAATIALQLIDQLMRSSRPTTELFSDRILEDLTYIQAQVWADKPDLRQVFARAVSVADGIEFRTFGEEGSGIKLLHEIEQELVRRQMGAR